MNRLSSRSSLLLLGTLALAATVVAQERGRPQDEGRPQRSRPQGGRRGGPPGGMLGMMPIMMALDADGDGELSESEIENATDALFELDKNNDGKLSSDELMPAFRGGRGGRPGGDFRRGGNAGPPPAPNELDPDDGTSTIPDRETFRRLSYQGQDVMIDTHLAGYEFVKFQIAGAGTDEPKLYFINTKKYRGHPMFMGSIGLPMREEGEMRGVLIYRPMLNSPGGEPGLYTFEFEPNDAFPFAKIEEAIGLLAAHSALMKGRLAYNLLPRAKRRYQDEIELYESADLPVFDDDALYADIGFLPLHAAESFGLLRSMNLEERPGPRDVVIYRTLPNEMPRVAGILTGFRQTPLSHVNLRAIQDDVPNAFVANVMGTEAITSLIGKYVYYRVSANGYELREASAADVEAHFAALRPAVAQSPPRDLLAEQILPFGEIVFGDSKSVGVKAANLATLRTLGFREDLVPDGYAIPFYFYDSFMRENGFYEVARAMIAKPEFQSDAAVRADALAGLRKMIKKGKMPHWMNDQLTEVQRAFPAETSIRCRSSTNNEDLPGFSGAGLYDSYTHKPDEGHLSKSIKQVYASLWNFRAFEERAFYRIDHFTSAMGVVLHPNSKDELANGVAVTEDILYGTEGQIGHTFYVNGQVGEDLVTNPDGESIPEELLLNPRRASRDKVIRRSNRVADGGAVLGAEHLDELRKSLGVIEREFARLYGVAGDAPFAMEVEFKVLASGKLFIKQARPWVR